jgi:putative heme-binding domain-containing protein
MNFLGRGLVLALTVIALREPVHAQAGNSLAVLVRLLQGSDDVAFQLDLLHGMSDGLRGQRNVTMPDGWSGVEAKLGKSANVDVRSLAQSLSLTFGSSNAMAGLRRDLDDNTVPANVRRSALDALLSVKDPQLPRQLQALLQHATLRGPALRGLAAYNDPKTPEVILQSYGSFEPVMKRDALNTLASRPAYANALLAAVGQQRVPAKDLTADIIRQLRNLKDASIQAQVAKIYGTVRETSADKKAEIEKYRRIYGMGGSQPGNASPGRVVFNKVCAQCHTLFDTGGKVGPDITGANRTDLNYLLETIVDPNAVIPNEYRATDIETKDGRSLTGLVKVQGDKALVLQTANELVTLPRDEIASQRQSELSMMPEGLLASLSDQEVRDLLYYLTRLGQVPLPPEAK